MYSLVFNRIQAIELVDIWLTILPIKLSEYISPPKISRTIILILLSDLIAICSETLRLRKLG